MTFPDLTEAAAAFNGVALQLAGELKRVFLFPGGTLPIASLVCALAVAVLLLAWRRRGRSRTPLRLAVLVRALFPRSIVLSRSTRADLGFFLFNAFVGGLLLGWALLSAHTVGNAVNGRLVDLAGPLSPAALPDWACVAILTFAAFLAYEFGFWLYHTLCHRIPLLWEFHKVHHQAEVLTPLTVFRLHPVDSLILVNMLALTMGTTYGLANWLFGRPVSAFTLFNVNALVLAFTYLLDHLHHTQLWIPFRGVWGRLLVSPAHHQIHHSTNPIHFGKNMGSCLAVFDWAFGTLHIPAEKREKLTFGVEPRDEDPHTVTAGLVSPVIRAAGHLIPSLRPPVPADTGTAARHADRQQSAGLSGAPLTG